MTRSLQCSLRLPLANVYDLNKWHLREAMNKKGIIVIRPRLSYLSCCILYYKSVILTNIVLLFDIRYCA